MASPRLTHSDSPVFIALWSLIPGLGHMFNNQILRGFLWATAVLAGYELFFYPGVVMHLLCMADAALSRPDYHWYRHSSKGRMLTLAAAVLSIIYITLRSQN
jgi:hypothetical protein